jgi:hypothetical protein
MCIFDVLISFCISICHFLNKTENNGFFAFYFWSSIFVLCVFSDNLLVAEVATCGSLPALSCQGVAFASSVICHRACGVSFPLVMAFSINIMAMKLFDNLSYEGCVLDMMCSVVLVAHPFVVDGSCGYPKSMEFS